MYEKSFPAAYWSIQTQPQPHTHTHSDDNKQKKVCENFPKNYIGKGNDDDNADEERRRK